MRSLGFVVVCAVAVLLLATTGEGQSLPVVPLGCWSDDSARTLPHRAPDYSGPDPIGYCEAQAAALGDPFFALQYGFNCFSGSEYRRFDQPLNGSLANATGFGSCDSQCPGAPHINCGGWFASQVYARCAAPQVPGNVCPRTCNLTSVLSSLPANTARGSCTKSLAANSSCSLSCVSPYQVVSGANYSCSSTGVLTGGQSCTDPVCAQTGPGHEVIVPVLGMRYTGPTAAALGSVISVSAEVPYPGPGLKDATPVVGSLAFEGPGVVPCTVSTEVVGTDSTAQCFLAVPVSSNGSSSSSTFPLSATFVYQKDWCVKYVGSVTSSLTLVNVGRMATVADAAAAGVAAEVGRASAAEAALRTDLTTEATARAQSDAILTTAVRNETARAVSAEGALAFNLSLVSSRVGALEVAEPSFLFRGLQSGIEVSYPNGQQPGAGIASMLNYPLRFDAPLSARGSAIRYNSTTGVVSIVQPGSYRLDAFVHLYSAQGASIVGTGVVAWMSVGAGAAAGAPPQPIGPNLLNPNAMGVPQGTVGDNTFVSTLLTVPEGTSPTAPFNAQCVLVSMNQRKNQITDASVISVTKLK